MPQKSKLEKLKNNIRVEESRLDEALNHLQMTHKENRTDPNQDIMHDQRWEELEKVVAVMSDLLSSYRKYTQELEKRTTE